ncbi:MAG: glycosyltransferase family 2 protein [Chthoniobacterales bacterium]
MPAFNEGGQIAKNLLTIRNYLSLATAAAEIIVVDDGSFDNTWHDLDVLQATIPEMTGIRLSRNFGKEAAISAGLNASCGRACLVMDSDLQHPPELIPEMIRLWREEGWDVVEGLKTTRGRESFLNRCGAWLFYNLLSRLSGYHLSGASDFKLLDRKVVVAWQEMQERNTFFRGMISWLGYTRKQVPFHVPERKDGTSRWSLLTLFRLAAMAITAFSSLPLQVITLLGGVFLLCSFLLGSYALVLYFRGLALPGFTTVILLELIIGGVLMISLGIIGTYLARIYEEAKHRPRYLIASTLRSDHASRHEEVPKPTL